MQIRVGCEANIGGMLQPVVGHHEHECNENGQTDRRIRDEILLQPAFFSFSSNNKNQINKLCYTFFFFFNFTKNSFSLIRFGSILFIFVFHARPHCFIMTSFQELIKNKNIMQDGACYLNILLNKNSFVRVRGVCAWGISSGICFCLHISIYLRIDLNNYFLYSL